MLPKGTKIRPNRYALSKLFTLAIVSISAIYLLGNQAKGEAFKAPPDLEGIKNERKNWEEILAGEDSAQFYKRLKVAYSGNYHKHTVGHIYGNLLFQKEGIGAITICDDGFFWGCYHGFIASGFSERRESAINEVVEVCRKEPDKLNQCLHGIGHGLFELYGENGLQRELDICEGIEGGSSCFTGVFMELNFPAIAEGGVFIQQIRPLVEKHRYTPCGHLKGEQSEACYYELPRWWERVMDSDFNKIGISCEGVKEANLRQNCYLGVGEIASLVTDHDLQETKVLCEKMPSFYGQAYCKIEASLGFSNVPEKKNYAAEVCRGLTEPYQNKCAK